MKIPRAEVYSNTSLGLMLHGLMVTVTQVHLTVTRVEAYSNTGWCLEQYRLLTAVTLADDYNNAG